MCVQFNITFKVLREKRNVVYMEGGIEWGRDSTPVIMYTEKLVPKDGLIEKIFSSKQNRRSFLVRDDN